MRQKARVTGYRITDDDRIESVFGDWDLFAKANDAPSLQDNNVVGYSLWNFVNGRETQSFLNALFFHVRRTGRPVRVQYNCSSPSTRRSATMSVRRLEQQKLEVEHNINSEERKTDVSLLTNPTKDLVVSICSQCHGYEIGGEWKLSENDDVLLEHDCKFVICPKCRDAARLQVDSS